MLCHWGFPVDRTTDAASTPTYKEKQMAIGSFYDINRDMYYSERDRFEREMQQRQMYAAQQQVGQNPFVIREGVLSGHAFSVQDPKDPLSFLSKEDNKLLLTGEAP